MSGPIVITGGGTGGHIFPMLAIADALVAHGVEPANLHLVGSRRGQEARLLGERAYPLTLLPGRGLRRSWRWRALVENVGALVGLASAFVLALARLRRWRPAVVVSLGGYAAAATGTAALAWRSPLVLVDLDAVPGAVHRVLAPFARRRLIPFGQTAGRVVVTGVPVRDAIATLDRGSAARQQARAALDPPLAPDRVIVVVMTGSLGSARVNRAVLELAHQWAGRTDLALIHVTGRRDAAWVGSGAPPPSALDYRVIEFADMVQWWALADVAVCRAGATTVAELGVLGIPAVLVPLPGAPGDHQARNADRVARAGGAVVLADGECDGAHLAGALDPLLDQSTRDAMGSAMAALGRPHATDDIAQQILALVRERS